MPRAEDCRCSKCGAKLARWDDRGRLVIERSGVKVTVARGDVVITCYWPRCQQQNQVHS
jgi:hypothetical protein